MVGSGRRGAQHARKLAGIIIILFNVGLVWEFLTITIKIGLQINHVTHTPDSPTH